MGQTNYKQAILGALSSIERDPYDIHIYRDAFALVRAYAKEDLKDALYHSVRLRELLDKPLTYKDKEGKHLQNSKDFLQLRNNILLFESPYLFDSYCQYLEINRPVEDRFYLPRRKTLKGVVDLLQKLADDELDEIFISMPPRVGKTTLLLFYTTWIMGRNNDLSNLYCSYSEIITTAFYKGILDEVLKDNVTYTYGQIFPNSYVADTNAKQCLIDMGRKKRYSSLTCRTLFGTLNGACDCTGILIADDLISGIEVALSPDRLNSVWMTVANNLLTRTKGSTKIIWVGTRWSIRDPIGIRLDMLQGNKNFATRRYACVNIPALNDRGETNFDFGTAPDGTQLGFTTTDYLEVRASYEEQDDMASWLAEYMGQPIEREGTLFMPDNLSYFNGELPQGKPDKVFMCVDVAFGGGDYLSAPICYQYGDDVYVVDWVFDNGDRAITKPKIVDAIMRNGVQYVQFESNSGGEEYKDFVKEDLESNNFRTTITSLPAPNDRKKEDRIFAKAPDIRHFFYLDANSDRRNRDYDLAMQNLFSFKMEGRNKHDDAPDSLAQCVDFAFPRKEVKAKIIQNPLRFGFTR